MDELIGTKLAGRYLLQALLGEGGLGKVYLARQEPIGRQVAVKLIQPELASNERTVARFEREARAASQVSHPSSVTIHDFGAELLPDGNRRLYLVMEYLRGETLSTRLSGGALSLEVAVEITSQVLDALSACHAAGIIHRDIKPENIMLCRIGSRERVKLLDFGIAKDSGAGAPRVTKTGFIMGTPSYMAPEQIAGSKHVGPSADLYAAGVLLFELLTGSAPFHADNQLELLKLHLSALPPKLTDRFPEAAHLEPFEAVIAKALAKHPSQRYATAEDFRRDLEKALSRAALLVEHLTLYGEETLLDEQASRCKEPFLRRMTLEAEALEEGDGVPTILDGQDGGEGPPTIKMAQPPMVVRNLKAAAGAVLPDIFDTEEATRFSLRSTPSSAASGPSSAASRLQTRPQLDLPLCDVDDHQETSLQLLKRQDTEPSLGQKLVSWLTRGLLRLLAGLKRGSSKEQLVLG